MDEQGQQRGAVQLAVDLEVPLEALVEVPQVQQEVHPARLVGDALGRRTIALEIGQGARLHVHPLRGRVPLEGAQVQPEGDLRGVPAPGGVLDDDGGGIFSYLPIAAHGDAVHFESLFRTPHGVDLRAAADLAGANYVRVDRTDEFRSALATSFERRGLTIVAVSIDAAANLAQHRELDVAVQAQLARLEFDADEA